MKTRTNQLSHSSRQTRNIKSPGQPSQKGLPDWDMDRVQGELLKQTCIHATASGNYALGLQAIRTDAQNRTLELKREIFRETLRTKIMSGIDALAEEAKKNPTVKAAVQQLRVAINAP